jgi:hypothetical protein
VGFQPADEYWGDCNKLSSSELKIVTEALLDMNLVSGCETHLSILQ